MFRLLIISLCVCSAQALAEDVAPPPEHKSVVTASDEHGDESSAEDTVDLRQSLVPEHIGKDVEVRAYIRDSDKAEITEYSRQGKVYMIKVDPPGDAPPYYLYDEDGDGQFRKQLPGGYKPLTPPAWEVKKF